MEKLIAISELFNISLDELIMDKETSTATESSSKTDFTNELKEKVFTDENKQKAKKTLKISAIIFGIVLLIDIVSMIVYFSLFGLPQ